MNTKTIYINIVSNKYYKKYILLKYMNNDKIYNISIKYAPYYVFILHNI